MRCSRLFAGSIVFSAFLVVLTGAPADAATAFSCVQASDPATPPPVRYQAPITTLDGLGLTSYAGIMIPQAVTQDTIHNTTDVAYFAALPVSSGAPQRAELMLAVIDAAGHVVYDSPLQAPSVLSDPASPRTDFVFDQSGAGNVNDSHNSLSIAVDSAGYVHMTGGIHNNTITYWRSSTNDGSIGTMTWRDDVPGIITFPNGVTNIASGADRLGSYPTLFTGPGGALFLSFRSGVSGNGDDYLYRYDVTTQTWSGANGGSVDSRQVGKPQALPLLVGKTNEPDTSASYGTVSATVPTGNSAPSSPYPSTPVQDPSGRWWMVWQWRASAASADTNMRLSAAYSTDLSTWYTVGGVRLPQSIVESDTAPAGLVVDDVPQGGGMLNDQDAISFDAGGNPVITYFKYSVNKASHNVTTQLFAARPNGQGKAWVPNQVSSWHGEVDLSTATPSTSTLQTDISGTAVAADHRQVALPYLCNGQARVITIGTGAYGGSSAQLSDTPITASGLPEAATQTYPSSAGLKVAPRTASSGSFMRDGRSVHWVMKWDAGPYVVDGKPTDPGVSGYPAAGTPITLYLLAD